MHDPDDSQIGVLIVDDSPSVRRILSFVVSEEPTLRVVGQAQHGGEAISMARELRPDAIVLDVEMPVIDGLDALAELRAIVPDATIVLFSRADATSDRVYSAVRTGAVEFVPKPRDVRDVDDAVIRLRRTLLPRLRAARPAEPQRARSTTVRRQLTPRTAAPIDAIVIGSSTGGPQALEAVIGGLSRDLPVPVFVVQHINEEFSHRLANRLADVTSLNVVEATRGDVVRRGTVYVAPGDAHMEVSQPEDHVRIRLHNGPEVNSCRPSVDVLFHSAANVYGPHQLAIVLTGMGIDGLEGCRAIAYRGAPVMVQDEASSVIWGMPGAVARADLADEIVPLQDIAARLTRWVTATHSQNSTNDVGPEARAHV